MNNSGVPGNEFEHNPFDYIEIRPGVRLWARLIDYILFEVIVFESASLAADIKIDFSKGLLLYITAIFLWVFVEAFLLSILGTTPGKWLLGVSVREEYGNKPALPKALKRSLLVWLYGIQAGIPPLFILGLAYSKNKLTAEKTTKWDSKSGCTVRHIYTSSLKIIAAAAIICAVIITQYNNLNLDRAVWDENTELTEGLDFIKEITFGGDSSAAYNCNERGNKLLGEGKYSEAKAVLLQGLVLNPKSNVRDSLYCNLSCACYNLEEYSASLDYIEEGLDILPNSTEEYLNHGNALYALGYTDEAEESYILAIKISDSNEYAHYGLGMVKYDNCEYDKALESFTKYTGLEKKDPDGWTYLGLCYLYGENDAAKAKECIDKALDIEPFHTFAVDSMAQYYRSVGAADKAAKLYENALLINPEDYTLLCNAAEFHYYSGSADKAVKFADLAIQNNSTYQYAYKIKAQAYLLNGEKQKAADTVSAMIEKNKDDPSVYCTAGDIYYSAYEYKLAGKNYSIAVERNPMNEDAHLGKIASLYYRKRYSACLDFALDSARKFDNANITWFIGDAYSALNDSEKAISYYKKASNKLPNNLNLTVSLGWEFFYNGDFQQAVEYADRVLERDLTNEYAKSLKTTAGKRLLSIVDQVSDFIESNYMYFKPNDEYNILKQKLKAQGSAGIEELCELFGTVYREGDMFSFILYDEYYREYINMCTKKTVENRALDNGITYIKISSFTSKTANEFLEVIDGIQDPESKYLVIDLRGNSGGDTNSGCNILDYLLPNCVVCNLIYNNGYSDSYYSDDEFIGFRHIFVLTDEKSASCSELVTLGLKTYLDNVTVIGGNTFGKGVGQTGFEDKDREMAIFIVNHYWNVREVNIMDKGIEPDVHLSGGSDEEYIREIRKLITNIYG